MESPRKRDDGYVKVKNLVFRVVKNTGVDDYDTAHQESFQGAVDMEDKMYHLLTSF